MQTYRHHPSAIVGCCCKGDLYTYEHYAARQFRKARRDGVFLSPLYRRFLRRFWPWMLLWSAIILAVGYIGTVMFALTYR